jgi:DNA-binding Lrp family transcriptional regulator
LQDEIWFWQQSFERRAVDHIDRALLAQLQQDATQSYAALGQAVGLSAGAAHEISAR